MQRSFGFCGMFSFVFVWISDPDPMCLSIGTSLGSWVLDVMEDCLNSVTLAPTGRCNIFLHMMASSSIQEMYPMRWANAVIGGRNCKEVAIKKSA